MHFINSRPRPKREGEMTLCETPRDFIPFLRGDNFFELDFSFSFSFFLSLFLLPAHGFATAQPTKYLTDWAQREGADQPLNTDPVCLLFVSHFCQVWQPIRLK